MSDTLSLPLYRTRRPLPLRERKRREERTRVYWRTSRAWWQRRGAPCQVAGWMHQENRTPEPAA